MPNGDNGKKMDTTVMGYIGYILGYFAIISSPNLRPLWYYSLHKPALRGSSGELALNCPVKCDLATGASTLEFRRYRCRAPPLPYACLAVL